MNAQAETKILKSLAKTARETGKTKSQKVDRRSRGQWFPTFYWAVALPSGAIGAWGKTHAEALQWAKQKEELGLTNEY